MWESTAIGTVCMWINDSQFFAAVNFGGGGKYWIYDPREASANEPFQSMKVPAQPDSMQWQDIFLCTYNVKLMSAARTAIEDTKTATAMTKPNNQPCTN